MPHVLLSVVLVSKCKMTLLTLDITVHLKLLCITAWCHTDLNGKKTSTSQRVGSLIRVALCSELTSPQDMGAQKNGARKDGSSGGLLASQSGESRHAVGGQMAASWGTTVTAGHISLSMKGGVLPFILHVTFP